MCRCIALLFFFFFFFKHLIVNWVEWEDRTGRWTASTKERRKSNNTTVKATTKRSDINNDGATAAKTQQQMNQPFNWQNTVLLRVPACVWVRVCVCVCLCMCKKALDSTQASSNYPTLPVPPKPLALPQPPNPSTLESPLPPPWPPTTVPQGGCLAGGQSPSCTGSWPIRVIHF